MEENKTKQADRPAFPTNARMHSEAQGITKREYFAAMAMPSFIKDYVFEDSIDGQVKQMDFAAKMAVKMADELLKQLES